MDYLWTPWRFQYISTAGQPSQECLFCQATKEKDDQKLLVVHRANQCLVMLNRFPYNSGHLMIAPNRHIALLEEASPAELQEIMQLTAHCQKGLREIYEPEGFNTGMNLGKCAGAGVAGHIHMHLLPRWTGDSNFMTVTGETRVLPEALDVTYQKVRKFFESHSEKDRLDY
ncbi:MAG TPA: HIT domain-containing protein [Acidobacteriota bacterium]|jgi:ATP adenylyltransferase